jgi:hypothetical protein
MEGGVGHWVSSKGGNARANFARCERNHKASVRLSL